MQMRGEKMRSAGKTRPIFVSYVASVQVRAAGTARKASIGDAEHQMRRTAEEAVWP
jgi:hypothetical protein